MASMNVRARGVAGVSSYALNCLYSLDPDGAGHYRWIRSGLLTTNCGVVVNSTDDRSNGSWQQREGRLRTGPELVLPATTQVAEAR